MGQVLRHLVLLPYFPRTHYNPTIWVSFSLNCWHPIVVGFACFWVGDLCQHLGLVDALTLCYVTMYYFSYLYPGGDFQAQFVRVCGC